MPDFAELCAAQARELWPHSQILLSDDRSEKSPEIEAAAERWGCSYIVSERRRTHCSGDWQAFVNGAVLAEQEGCEIVLKLSQRCIPVAPDFRKRVDWYFDPAIGRNANAIMPSRLNDNQIARPGAELYLKLGHLSDILAFRVSVISPTVLLEHYNASLTTGWERGAGISEVVWGNIKAAVPGVELVDWLSNMEPMKPKVLLRKASSNSGEYARLAERWGITGAFDVGEWNKIEARSYRGRPVQPSIPV